MASTNHPLASAGSDDSGLTVYPTHRLLSGLAANADIRDHLINGIHAAFDVTETDRDGLDPAEMDGLGCFGFADGVGGRYYRLRLADPASLERLMPGRSEAYRQLDAAILEQVVLHGGVVVFSQFQQRVGVQGILDFLLQFNAVGKYLKLGWHFTGVVVVDDGIYHRLTQGNRAPQAHIDALFGGDGAGGFVFQMR